jgi:hypothetical protein
MFASKVDDGDMRGLPRRPGPEVASTVKVERMASGKDRHELADKAPAWSRQALGERVVVADEETVCTRPGSAIVGPTCRELPHFCETGQRGPRGRE